MWPICRTYTLKFPDVPGEDEVDEAVAAAAAYDCRHTVVEVTSREVADILPRFAGELDQPSADGLNTWLISRAAARDVKGVLSGIGGDEWFAGYPVTRRMARYATTASRTRPGGCRSTCQSGRPLDSAGRIARASVEPGHAAQCRWPPGCKRIPCFATAAARRMAGLPFDRGHEDRRIEAILNHERSDWRKETAVGLSCLLDTRVYMINQLLRDSDATSMAHSLELRVPLVDLALVAFSRSCDDDYKLRPDGGSSNQYTAAARSAC